MTEEKLHDLSTLKAFKVNKPVCSINQLER